MTKKTTKQTKKQTTSKKIAPKKAQAKKIVSKKVTRTRTKVVATKLVKKNTASKKNAVKKVTTKKSVDNKKATPLTKKNSTKKIKTAPTKATPVSVKKTHVTSAIPTSGVHPLYKHDLDFLSSGLWGNLNLCYFSNVVLNNSTIDAVFSSDDTALIVTVLSDDDQWIVDTKTDTWTTSSTIKTNVITTLFKQRQELHNVDPKARIIPVILLMRGSIKNEVRLHAYLQERDMLLVRVDQSVAGHAPILQDVWEENFEPIISPTLSREEFQQFLAHEKTVGTNASRKMVAQPALFSKKKTKSLAAFFATVAHTGYFPKGSGTIGSLIALPLAYVLNQYAHPFTSFVTIIALLIIGLWSVSRFTRDKVEKDPSSVIIDEVVGQLIPFAFVAPQFLHWPLLLLGFVTFRFFDICKFGLVKYFDKQKNAWGVMMDDVLAGLRTAIILLLTQAWWLFK